MTGPLIALEESAERLAQALAAQKDPPAAIEECATELSDTFNRYAYQLEQDIDKD